MEYMGLIQRSFYGGILILVILALRAALLYRLPKRTFPILWGVALARLLLPFSFSSICSVYSLFQSGPEPVLPEYGLYEIGEGAAAVGTAADWTGAADTALGSTSLSAAGERKFPVLPAVWGIGAALCALFFARAYLRNLRDFRNAVPVEDDRIGQWLRRHKAERLISVRQSERIAAPLTYGILHPVILLPGHLLETDSPELEYVLQHEYVHIRHDDAAMKLAMVAALCIHWFNPLVWVMCGLLNLDIELSCDEGVLRKFGEQSRAGYAMALIGMEEKKRSLLPLYNGFSKNATEERITLIMRYQKIKRATGAAAMVLVLSVALVFATSARPSQAADDSAASSGNGSQPGLADLEEGDLTDIPMDPPRDGTVSGGSSPEEPDQPAVSEPTHYTLSYMQEGMPNEIPATLYTGNGYGILIPTEGWQAYGPDAWMWAANEQVQFWVSDCSGSSWEQELARLEKDGYSQAEGSDVFMKESEGRFFFAQMRGSGSSMMCLHYTYPSDAEYTEGFQTPMQAIAASFSLLPGEADSELSEEGKQLQHLAQAFWEAYLAGNTEAVRQYLSEDHASGIDVFPDGLDGHVAEEAALQAVKGLEASDAAAGGTCTISLEFRPAAGADYLEYLTLEAVREADGWKVLSYGLEM